MGDGYTHDPDAFDEHGEVVDQEALQGDENVVDTEAMEPDRTVVDHEAPGDDPTADGRESEPRPDGSEPTQPEAADRSFDWRGWVLVAAIAVCFLVIPAVILAYPYVGQQFGLSFYDTYLALPMIPAVVLAALAVWATTRP